jgi:hypothetical protein
VVDGIKETSGVCFKHPVDLFLHDPDKKCIQRMVRAAPRSVSIGEAQEIFLVDGIKDRHHSLLGNLVLQGSYAQTTKLAVFLSDIGPLGRLRTVGPPVNALMQIDQTLPQAIFVLSPSSHQLLVLLDA